MLVDTVLVNAKIPTAQGVLEGGIAIEDGRIRTIAKEANLPRADSRIDVCGNIVMPGLIDAHVHLRDQELAYKEDFFTGTCAAAAGGFTTVLDMPSYAPPTDSALRLRERMEVARGKVVVNVGFYASFPSETEEIDAIVEAGAIGFKVNPFQPMSSLDIEDDMVLSRAFERAAGMDTLVAVHAEKRSLVRRLEEGLKDRGDVSIQAYLRAHPPRAEVEDVERLIRLARETKVRVHFSHISTPTSVSLITRARGEGVKVSSEVTPHNLLLTEETLSRLGEEAVMDPPLRSDAEIIGLFEALVKGDVDIVASDHAPHSLEEKRRANVWEIRPGVPGLETTLPVLLTMVNDGRLTLNRLIELLAQRPAKIFRLGGKGLLRPGYDADLTVVNLTERHTIDPPEFYSKAKYSPFRGWRATGRAVKTVVRGRIVMEDGEVISRPGDGRILGRAIR